jgi:hypothetical protein
MTDWQIRIPHRDRDAPLADLGDLVRHLPDPAERAVARQLAVDAAADGCRTVGDLLDRLESSSPGARRGIAPARAPGCLSGRRVLRRRQAESQDRGEADR